MQCPFELDGLLKQNANNVSSQRDRVMENTLLKASTFTSFQTSFIEYMSQKIARKS